MKTSFDHVNLYLTGNKTEIVVWGDKFATGIELIDLQHMELVKLTNQLYQACLAGDGHVADVFKAAMRRMVNYVRFHFTAEMEFLKKINYPGYNDHKAQHDLLVKDILTAVAEFESGKKYTPNLFVRTLRDWVFGHIAYFDKNYAVFAAEKGTK